MIVRVTLDPARLMGGNFGVDGTASAERLAGSLGAKLREAFPHYEVVMEIGPESVRVSPANAAVEAEVVNLVGAARKAADYLVFVD